MPNACCVKIRGNAREGRDRVTTTELPFATTDETSGKKDCTVCGAEACCAPFFSSGCAASEALAEADGEALAETDGVAAPDGDA